jgi:hypothetical protein
MSCLRLFRLLTPFQFGPEVSNTLDKICQARLIKRGGALGVALGLLSQFVQGICTDGTRNTQQDMQRTAQGLPIVLARGQLDIEACPGKILIEAQQKLTCVLRAGKGQEAV